MLHDCNQRCGPGDGDDDVIPIGEPDDDDYGEDEDDEDDDEDDELSEPRIASPRSQAAAGR